MSSILEHITSFNYVPHHIELKGVRFYVHIQWVDLSKTFWWPKFIKIDHIEQLICDYVYVP